MNARRVPFEGPKERSRVCFGGFRLPARSRFGEGRPYEACGAARGFNPWGSTFNISGGDLLQFLTPLESPVVYSEDEDNFFIGANPVRRPKIF